ncbi:2-amino-4-hydroxy-6-hydroxymethyldihydropteridine diphosphokinase [Erythrobacter litoralis]|uniref:2-amino-4-hydroxy-6-hydroxymethyldihydropteridine pyrophosphokinase n=1 Tax=Erythrobacter litoralis (strain HTCC2594) TaxID=314225 RepID=Q2N7J5_ERYLH|nr:2-amino-4-hydroxy-6-hydroxymethyldihydropteridine diphosphokinase [Erythrobacter litoralis]ABC64346.1 7,8-dihydro-6-hydroxymethylpterin-pyrophosphokinase [Erythrobacter litoralis HTCC2594]
MRGHLSSTYLVALGSNRPHHLYGRPRAVVHAAMEELAVLGTVTHRSPIIATAPLGAAQRRFANAAALVESELDPEAMLAGLQHIENGFGRRRWRRWGDRVLDLDIVLWSEGAFAAPGLQIPHPAFRERAFVMTPALAIAPAWRDPVSGRSLRHLNARLTRKHPRP